MQLIRIPYCPVPIRISFTVLSIKSTGPARRSHQGEELGHGMSIQPLHIPGTQACIWGDLIPCAHCWPVTLTSLVLRDMHVSLPLFLHWRPGKVRKPANRICLLTTGRKCASLPRDLTCQTAPGPNEGPLIPAPCPLGSEPFCSSCSGSGHDFPVFCLTKQLFS